MKILLLSSYLPYPLFSGGQVRLYNLIKELSQKHEITLICEKRSQQTDADIAELKKICKDVIAVERRKQWSISNIVKAGISSHSFLVTGHTHPEFAQRVREALAGGSYDLIHVETYYIMRNLLELRMTDDGLQKIPIVLVEHNIEYQVYEKFMQRAPALLIPLLRIDTQKIKREEEYYWQQSNALVAVSREDQAVMKKAGHDSFLVPNGVNTNQFIFRSFEERFYFSKRTQENVKKILFLGDFRWIQNKDSVTFIIKEIFPLVKKELRITNHELDVKLWIVGRKIPESIRNLTNDQDVLFDEKSSGLSTEKIFQEAAVLLAPIRIGGGTSYKILEAMSSGTPVVTMQMSADALSAVDGKEILVGKTAEELAEKSLEVLQNESLYTLISKNGRALVEKQYTWKKIGKRLEAVYLEVVK